VILTAFWGEQQAVVTFVAAACIFYALVFLLAGVELPDGGFATAYEARANFFKNKAK